MSQLIETIKCHNSQLYNIHWHNIRFNQARKEYFGLHTKMNLTNFIKIPSSFKKGLFRCRITYSKSIEKIEYLPHRYKKIESLRLIEDNDINYTYKYSDRENLNCLFEKRGICDDILIVKNGCITDSLTANSIFFDGSEWWTPDTPLLPGTQRAKLIEEGKISVCRITTADLSKYQKVGLINALQDFENMPVIKLSEVYGLRK